MKTSRTSTLTTMAALAALSTLLAACNANPPRASACTLPEGHNLERAISAARFDLTTGCEQQFDEYFQRLLVIAEGDPKKDNKVAFSDFLIWANEEGLLSKRQARELYTRYFGVKYVTLISDYSVCAQTCPRQQEVMREMNRELVDKEQGLLKVSADQREYYRANRLFQETELVLDATCEACGPVE
jgi:hypothetical protein